MERLSVKTTRREDMVNLAAAVQHPVPGRRRTARALLLAAGLLAAACFPAWAAGVETAHLVVSDASGRLSREQIGQRAARVQTLFEKVLAFWDVDPGVERFGKIRVVFNAPGQLQLSVFRWVKDGGRMAREVLAAPSGQEPQMLAHKLTSALFPSKDKLVRNMMGDVSETRLGNPRPFPACGLGVDAWVLALDRLGMRLPLRELGPDHASWGMGENEKGVPFTTDPDRHHRTYAEAGSFGAFLFEAYGMEKLKQLCQQTGDLGRPWEAVYGAGLETLEARWLEALRAEQARLEPEIALAAELYRQDPAAACGQALARPAARP